MGHKVVLYNIHEEYSAKYCKVIEGIVVCFDITCLAALTMATVVASLSLRMPLEDAKRSREALYTSSSSTLLMISCCMVTDSMGYLPAADSADSITASDESKIAVAQSEASARVGVGFSIMDSIIWVAMTTGLPSSLHVSTMRFWMTGTSQGFISTPRSPRATMMPSLRSTIYR